MSKNPKFTYLFERLATHNDTDIDEPEVEDVVAVAPAKPEVDFLPEPTERIPQKNRRKGKHVDAGPSSSAHTEPVLKFSRVSRYARSQQAVAAEGSWLATPEIPTSDEVLDFTEPTSENIINGPWPSKESYLSSHYSFLRAEAVSSLRDAINVVRSCPAGGILEYAIDRRVNQSGIGIYNKVHIRGYTFTKRGIGIRVSFSLDAIGKNVKWDQSKRLITGSLVALTPTNDIFNKRCIIATVAARPIDNLQLNPSQIDLFFANGDDIEVDINTEWLMVEARSSFFEAQRHTLLALQKMYTEDFPLAQHLIDLEQEIPAPVYVQHNPSYNLQSVFEATTSTEPRYNAFKNVNIVSDWPSSADSHLDDSQQQALHAILAKQLAIIQGPPGTGKTRVSVEALDCMLRNALELAPPIIISCQTNHALDQLLRFIAKIPGADFVRLGGRSKDTTGVIQNRTLFHLRQKLREERHHTWGSAKTMTRLSEDITKALQPLRDEKAFLDYSNYRKWNLLTQAQCDSLEGGNPHFDQELGPDETPLQGWLGQELVPNHVLAAGERYKDDEEEDILMEELEELEAEGKAADIEDDIERLRGDRLDLAEGYIGKPSNLTDEEVEKHLRKADLWDIPKRFRGTVFDWLQRQVRIRIRREVTSLANKYHDAASAHKYARFEDDLALLRRQKIIGLTTTGLSKYRALIDSLEPQIILIEEAAESLEAPVIAACMESVQQLILIGDHKQLQPNCVLHESEERHWNISMFERLVDNGLPHNSLCTQRRMKPEIRRVLHPIYEDLLKDHNSMKDVAIRPDVPGMGGINCYFFTHEWLDSKNENMSAINVDEADMLVGFVDYLIKNGVERHRITILTFYNGQRAVIAKKLRQHPDLRMTDQQVSQGVRPWNVFTVDSYQGEENDIVLLSCVRSNEVGQIGFLKKDNRVCVALSRARRGFYIFGNAENLACESRTWSKVVTILSGKGKGLGAIDRPDIQPRRIGYRLPICCSNHGRMEFLRDSASWLDFSGGCRIKCTAPLRCGHQCPLFCHPFDPEHQTIACIQPCPKPLPCGHDCSRLCGELPCHCSDCNKKYHDVAARASQHQTQTQPDEFPAPPPVKRGGGSSEAWQDFSNGGYAQHDREQAQIARGKGKGRLQ